jgi:membrane protease YdiL (CAAX protease family)
VIPAADQLQLPGPRWLWWLLGVAGVLLPGVTVLAPMWMGAKPMANRDVEVQVRDEMLRWRIAHSMLPARRPVHPSRGSAPNPSKPLTPMASEPATDAPATTLPADPTATTLPLGATEVTDGWRQLFERGLSLDRAAASSPTAAPAASARARPASQSELVVALAVATRHDALARALAADLPAPSTDLRAALRGLEAPSDMALAPTEAVATARARGFGSGWSPYLRERVRLRVEAAGNPNAELRSRTSAVEAADRRVGAFALAMGLFLGLAFVAGGVWLLLHLVRGLAMPEGDPAAALRGPYPGLSPDARLLADPLVPLLGGAAWLLGYVTLAMVAAQLAAPLPGHGLSSLFTAMAGLLLAWAVAQAFSRGRQPWRIESAMPFWPASTAALRAYCVLLPTMLVVVVVNALLVGPGDPHPVVGHLLDDAGLLQLGVTALAVVVVAPLGEELLFRGFLYRWLRDRWGVGRAVALTSLLFAVLHVAPAALGPYVLLGAAFALVFEWTGSLWASVVLHGLWNAVVFAWSAMLALS